jgi:hypothetical protein
MFATGNRVRIKATCESRSGVTLPGGATGKVHFVPGPDWGNEIVIILDKAVTGPKNPTPRTYVLVEFQQVELLSATE